MQTKDRLQIAWQAFSMENSLLQSYRVLFMMVEAALLGLGFVLDGAWILAPCIIGCTVAVTWILVCEFKKRDVDRCRDRIIELESLLGEDWLKYLKRGFSPSGGNIARYIFNYVIPILIVALWIFVVRLEVGSLVPGTRATIRQLGLALLTRL